MEKDPLIKQGWLRAMLFLICLLLIMISLMYLLALVPGFSTLAEPGNREAPGHNQLVTYLEFLCSSLACLLTVFLFRKLIDRRSLESLGFSWKGRWTDGLTGFFIGLLLLGTGTLILVAAERISWIDLRLNSTELTLSLGLMIMISFAEELVFRGYLLNNFLQSMNKWLALGLSALVFALFHINNPALNAVAMINLLLSGLLLGINYIYTRNLWFGILLHFSWNFYQGAILGYQVSGVQINSVFQQELYGNVYLTGGGFGFEGSLVCTALCVTALAGLTWYYEKKLRGLQNLPSA